jgi:cytochrome P450
MIHQLFLFLLAGEDTTGTFIEKSLATLATYPQYQ